MMQSDAHTATTDTAPQEQPRPRKSKMDKKQKNLYLSAHARQLLAILSYRMGLSETAVTELLIREKAAREGISYPIDALGDTKLTTQQRDDSPAGANPLRQGE
jgi:hypothetical protein